MLLALLLLTAASPVMPGELSKTDQSHSWKLSPTTVSFLEKSISVPSSMGGPLNNFDRYYTGVFREGRKIVFIELTNLIRRAPGSGTVHLGDPESVPVIADGGCSIMRLAYDPQQRSFSELQCNGELGVPPPPPTTRP